MTSSGAQTEMTERASKQTAPREDDATSIMENDVAPARRAPLRRGVESKRPREHARLMITDLSVEFGGLRALDSVTLWVMPGEVVSLLGPNGAGKSTLLNTVSGMVRYTGSVFLDGRSLDSLVALERAREGMARTFQRMELFDELTTLDNLVVSRELRRPLRVLRGFFEGRGARASDVADAEEILALLGILQYAQRYVSDLSTGVRRLVELGRVLMCEPRLVLLDEPSSGLDRAETARFNEVIRELCRAHPDISVLLVEHDMSVALELASHVYVLNFGSLIAEGDPSAVRSDERVRSAYLGTGIA